jgi:hypothetical protein
MSAKSLLRHSLNNCQLVRDSLTSQLCEPNLEIDLLDCIQKIESILEQIKEHSDWDAEGFESYLNIYRTQRKIKRDMAAITHLVTPLCSAPIQ